MAVVSAAFSFPLPGRSQRGALHSHHARRHRPHICPGPEPWDSCMEHIRGHGQHCKGFFKRPFPALGLPHLCRLKIWTFRFGCYSQKTVSDDSDSVVPLKILRRDPECRWHMMFFAGALLGGVLRGQNARRSGGGDDQARPGHLNLTTVGNSSESLALTAFEMQAPRGNGCRGAT